MAPITKDSVYGSEIKDVTKLAWPIMLSMATTTVMDVTDTLMVGWLGTKELAAVGIATTVFLLCKSLFLGTFESIKILVAQAVGSGSMEKAKSFGLNSLFLLIPCSLLVFSLSFFSNEIFSFFGGPQDIQALAIEYFNIRTYAPIFWFTIIALSNFYQGIGDTKTPMIINIFVCILNIILDPIFIFGFGSLKGFGVAGSAIATELSFCLGSLIFLWLFKKKVGFSKSFDLNKVKKLFSLGWPSGIRWFVDMAGFTVFTALVARLGTNELAANQIGVKILCISILPAWGISEAACILVGHHSGASRMPMVKKSFLSALYLGLMAMGFLGVLFLIFKNPIVSMFQPTSDVKALALDLILAIAIYQFFETIQNTCAMSLNGLGNTRFPMILTLALNWGVMIPLSYLMGIYYGFGLKGMWFSLCISLVLLSIAFFTKLYKAMPKSKVPTHDNVIKDPIIIHTIGPEKSLS